MLAKQCRTGSEFRHHESVSDLTVKDAVMVKDDFGTKITKVAETFRELSVLQESSPSHYGSTSRRQGTGTDPHYQRTLRLGPEHRPIAPEHETAGLGAPSAH